MNQAQHTLDGGGLASTVGAEQAEHLATPDLEADPLHGLHLFAEEADAEGLLEVLDRQHGLEGRVGLRGV